MDIERGVVRERDIGTDMESGREGDIGERRE